MNLLTRIFFSSIAVLIVSYLLPGIIVQNFVTAIVVAVLFSLLNVTIKPILIFLTIPLTIVSLGLFLLVINAIIILIAGAIVPDFGVDDFWWALVFSVLLSLVNSLLSSMYKKDQK